MAGARQWEGTAHSRVAQALLFRAGAADLDVGELLRRFDLDGAELADIDGRIPLVTLKRLWEELPTMIGDPDLALHLARSMADSVQLPLSAYLFLNSATLGDALRRSIRYERLRYDNGAAPTTELAIEDGRAWVRVRLEVGVLVPPTSAVLFEFALFRGFADRATAQAVPILEVRVRHPRPRNEGEYREYFRSPVIFEADEDAFALPASALSLPHPNATEDVLAILDRYASQQVASLPRATVEARAREAIRVMLPDGAPTLDRVAERLGTGPRRLQRQLEAEGCSLRSLVDHVRRELALALLRDGGNSIADIAFALGFSDQTTFHRAFVRWTTRTPGEYRRVTGP